MPSSPTTVLASCDRFDPLDPEERPTSCAPFRCKDATCLDACVTTDDCVVGTACASGRCDPPAAPTALLAFVVVAARSWKDTA